MSETQNYGFQYGWSYGQNPGVKPLDDFRILLDSLIQRAFQFDPVKSTGLTATSFGGTTLTETGALISESGSASPLPANAKVYGVVAPNGKFAIVSALNTENYPIFEIETGVNSISSFRSIQPLVPHAGMIPTSTAGKSVQERIDEISATVAVTYSMNGDVISTPGQTSGALDTKLKEIHQNEATISLFVKIDKTGRVIGAGQVDKQKLFDAIGYTPLNSEKGDARDLTFLTATKVSKSTLSSAGIINGSKPLWLLNGAPSVTLEDPSNLNDADTSVEIRVKNISTTQTTTILAPNGTKIDNQDFLALGPLNHVHLVAHSNGWYIL